MLSCHNITKQYFQTVAVNNLSLDIEPGKLYALLGPNGSGKTTLMKMIAGLTSPTKGAITLDGAPLTHRDKARITYMPTEGYFFNYMNINDIAKYYMDFFGDFNYSKFVDLIRMMELPMLKKVRYFSSGMMAKLKIALALARESAIIMLDEPLNGIDIIAREQVVSAIKNNLPPTSSVIVSSHLVDELQTIVDGAIFLRQGTLVYKGDMADVRATGKSLVDMYREIYGSAMYQQMYNQPQGYGYPPQQPYGYQQMPPQQQPYGYQQMQPQQPPYGYQQMQPQQVAPEQTTTFVQEQMAPETPVDEALEGGEQDA